MQPGRLGLGADPEAVVVAVKHVDVARVVVKWGGRDAVADVVRRVVVHAVEVVAAFHEDDFFGCERRQSGAELGDHACWIAPEVDWVGKP